MIGQLRHRVDIRARILNPDDVGGAAPSWASLESAWAGIVHLSSTRTNEGARDNRLKRLAATLRYRSNITLGQRLRCADTEYDIVSIETAGGKERFMILVCEEVALMSAGTLALQKGLYDRLRADGALVALLGDPPRVFDAPPASAPFPYIVIGETRAAPIPGHDGGVEHDIRIEMFSRHAGRQEVKRLIDALFAALHGADFPLDSARLVNCRFVFADVYRNEGGDLFRGLARFRCVSEAL